MSGVILFFDTKSGMRHGAEPFLGNQFARCPAYAVCFVIDSGKSSLEVVDKLKLSLGQTCGGFAFESIGTFLKSFECRGSIGGAVTFVGAQRWLP